MMNLLLTCCLQSQVVVAVNKVPRQSCPVSGDAREDAVVQFEVVSPSDLEGFSCVTCPAPASLASQSL